MLADLKLLTPEAFFQRRNRLPLAPYVWAALILAAGSSLAFSMRHQLNDGVIFVLRCAYATSFAITAINTFRWGRECGFVVRDAYGDWSLTNLLRNSVMTLVMFVCVLLAGLPLVGVATAVFR